MSLFDVFKQSIKNEKPVTGSRILFVGDDTAKRSYLKIMAKNTVLDFVASTMSTLDIKFKNNSWNNSWDYILNVRP